MEQLKHNTPGLETNSNANQRPPVAEHYPVKVDNETVVFATAKVTGHEILAKAGKTPVECYSLYIKLEGCDFDRISLDESVDLSHPGLEHFVTKEPEVFYYTVDDEPETTDLKEMTPNKILSEAGIDPTTHYLVQVSSDGAQTSYKDKGDQPIKMECPQMTFVSVLNGPTPVS